MPRFTILEHNHPVLHWDLLLETGQPSLKTWRLLKRPEPACQASETQASEIQASEIQQIPAKAIEDHRLEYLDYEGPVSQQRGEVKQWDTGFYLMLIQSDQFWEFRLEGKLLQGFAVLRKEIQTEENDNWTFTFLADREEAPA